MPMHLRNAPTKLMQEMGMGATYRLRPRRTTHAYAAGEDYLPEGDAAASFGISPPCAGLEAKIAENGVSATIGCRSQKKIRTGSKTRLTYKLLRNDINTVAEQRLAGRGFQT